MIWKDPDENVGMVSTESNTVAQVCQVCKGISMRSLTSTSWLMHHIASQSLFVTVDVTERSWSGFFFS